MPEEARGDPAAIKAAIEVVISDLAFELEQDASHSLHRLRNAWADVTLPSRVCGTVFSSQDQSNFLRDFAKGAAVVAIEPVRTAAKCDEVIEVAVVIDVGPRVCLAANRGEYVWLNQFERRTPGRGLHRGEGEDQERDAHVRAPASAARPS